MKQAISGLYPGYFSLVMATGIVSLAARMEGMQLISMILFRLNVCAYLALWALNILRCIMFPIQFFTDLTDHLQGPGFFTSIAATCVLGLQFLQLYADYRAAMVLWVLAIVLWIVFTYVIFAGLTIKEEKPPISEGITGSWLLAVVATQSVAVLGAQIAANLQQVHKLELNFFALSLWLWGGMLYIWMISLIFYRYTFFRFSSRDLSPLYWINMGAMAISTLAGAHLIDNSRDAPFLSSLIPFLKGFTVFYWATGTWWIPMLLCLSLWSYVWKREPLRYDPHVWGAVFPLGMYAVCTSSMAGSLDMGFLNAIPHIFAYLALLVWAAAFAGLVKKLSMSIYLHTAGNGRRKLHSY